MIDVSQLKNKESNYKALYKDWTWLRGQSGFGRDLDIGGITASVQAWTEVIKVYFYCFYICMYLIIIKSKTCKTCGWHRFNSLKYIDTLDESYSTAIATSTRAFTL